MKIPWDGMGWDEIGINCCGMGWDGTEKYVPCTSLPVHNPKVGNFRFKLLNLVTGL